jgi:predicted ATP-binding protein involved in virulence
MIDKIKDILFKFIDYSIYIKRKKRIIELSSILKKNK